MSWINVAKIIEVTEAEGPGLRTAIWVQGCLKRCQGCCNGRFLRIQPAEIITIYQVIEIINTAKEKHQIEGITLLGGEPFLQAESLSLIAEFAKRIGLSVMVFTGYNLEELSDVKFRGAMRLLSATDVLVDGEYDIENTEFLRNWVGSTNQKFYYFTDFYSNEIEKRKLAVTKEWRIKQDGYIMGNGLPFKMSI